MKRLNSTIMVAVFVTGSLAVNAQELAPLRIVRTIQLPPEIKGAFDHLAVDLKHNRLFATPEDYKAVLVLDLTTGKVIQEITGIARPHAVLYREDLNRIYVTDGGDGALKTFDGGTYKLLHTVPLAKDADSIGYDTSRNLLYIDAGGKDEGQTYSLVSIIDTTSSKKVTEIKIDGETLEAMALDVFRPRMYVNNKAKNQIEVIDRWKGAVVASWPVTSCKDNVAMGLDEQHQRLFVGCRSGKMAILDTNTGKELQTLPITTGVDDLVYDAGSKRIYAAGKGVVSVFEQTDADHYRSLGNTESGPGGKTALLVPALNRYFVAVPQHGSDHASIVEMEAVGVRAYKSTDPTVAIPLESPAAENLLLATMSAHPYLRKMGLHAIPPGHQDSVIVANALASRIGVKTTAGDFEAVKDGATYCVKRDDGSFYNAKMPMFDAVGRRIGILVMEIPFTSANDQPDAVRQAEALRKELSRQIPSLDSLFHYTLDTPRAPLAQKLLDESMGAHPELQKMGLHAVPPAGNASAIIASNYPNKIGKKSSEGDLSVVQSGKPTVKKLSEPAPFYDLALPLHDATGNAIGMIVMELRGPAAKNESDALQQAESITAAIQKQIPSRGALFADN